MRDPNLIPGPVPPSVTEAACRLPDMDPATAIFIQIQQALGATIGEAIGAAAAVHGEAAVGALLGVELDRAGMSSGQVDLLRGVAKMFPGLANTALNARLSSGRMPEWKGGEGKDAGIYLRGCDWITGLPPSFRVGGPLWLQGCTSLEHLPDDLRVGGACNLLGCAALKALPDYLAIGGYLWLKDCSLLQALPVGLQVGGWMSLVDCPSWDGHIPEDTQVGLGVYTDRHPEGISLPEWRKLYPAGERA